MRIGYNQYKEILNGALPIDPGEKISLVDHLGGFDCDLRNPILDKIWQNYDNPITTQYRFDDRLRKIYSRINLDSSFILQQEINFKHFFEYKLHPILSFKKFVCSFNGSAHVSRKLLVSIIKRFGWFDPETCSKNFQFIVDRLDGHLVDYLDHDTYRLYRPFFISDDSRKFFDSIYSFGHVRFDHANNIYNLENKLTSSFLHVVSETLATSYYPFVTEKFLYSVVTRGLFLAYAQPGWHDHLERYYGFRKYSKIFDYKFDGIQNPIERLIELMSMIAKFSVLSSDDWRDLYEMESDTIEYNYDHYFSRDYLKFMQKHV